MWIKPTIAALLLVLAGCAANGLREDSADGVLLGQFLEVELLSSVERSRELPVAQALIAERPGRIHLSYLGQVDPALGESWLGASGSRVFVAWGRVQRVDFLSSELRAAQAGPDPVADWMAGLSGWPVVGAVTERWLQLPDEAEPVREVRRVVALQVAPVVIQAGGYTALRIVEELEYPGTPFRYRAELWVDPFSRELLWLRGPVRPGGPELVFELVVPVQRQLPGS